MKRLYFLLIFVTFTVISNGQVGINTTTPTAGLDVNGTMRVRQFFSNNAAVFILGMDEDGNIVQIQMGEDVELQGNIIKSTSNFESFATNLPDLSTLIGGNGSVNNLNILILPGYPNRKKSIFQLPNGTNTSEIDITGIADGTIGRRIILQPTSGRIRLIEESTDSLPENRIRGNNQMKVNQYSMIELIYDGSRWVIMSHSN